MGSAVPMEALAANAYRAKLPSLAETQELYRQSVQRWFIAWQLSASRDRCPGHAR